MKAYVDLHIHSALSPCADNEMTPNNIVNMAYIKGLNIIAVTDHNSVENCEAVIKCAKKAGIEAIPGMELETSEEVHLVCLFKDLEKALAMQDIVYKALPDMDNREDIFGQQLIMDEEDNVKGSLKRMLITATSLSIEEVFRKVRLLGGVVIPAHVDRDSYSMISNLGGIPEELGIKHLEISRMCELDRFLDANPMLKGYKFIRNSDAHTLGDILEPDIGLELEEASTECLIEALRT